MITSVFKVIVHLVKLLELYVFDSNYLFKGIQNKPLWGTKVGEAIQVPGYSNFGDPNVLDTNKDEFLLDSKKIFGEEVYVG